MGERATMNYFKAIFSHQCPIWFMGVVLMAFSSSCSYQWREADAGIDDQDLIKLIDEIGQTTSTSSGSTNMTAFVNLAHDPQTAIYFAEGSDDHQGPMGPPASILSMEDFTFMGQPEVTPLDMTSARAIFLDYKNEAGVRKNALLIDYFLRGQDKSVTKVFMSQEGAAFINDGEFEVELDSGGTKLIVRSLDLVDDSDELKGVIQLNAWDFTSDNVENYLGKISTMVGFGLN